jgi:hypothetical protein
VHDEHGDAARPRFGQRPQLAAQRRRIGPRQDPALAVGARMRTPAVSVS